MTGQTGLSFYNQNITHQIIVGKFVKQLLKIQKLNKCILQGLLQCWTCTGGEGTFFYKNKKNKKRRREVSKAPYCYTNCIPSLQKGEFVNIQGVTQWLWHWLHIIPKTLEGLPSMLINLSSKAFMLQVTHFIIHKQSGWTTIGLLKNCLPQKYV